MRAWVVLVLLVILSLGCVESFQEGDEEGYQKATQEPQETTKYSEQQIESVMSQYQYFLDLIWEDIDNLSQIVSRYPAPVSNEQYIYFANEYSIQLQYACNHDVAFKEFVYENEDILKSQGKDTYKLKMQINDLMSTHISQAKVVEQNLSGIQYQQEQQQRQQEEILDLLLSLAVLAI